MSVTTPILQCGTSRFLQACVDPFAGEALKRNEKPAPIAAVRTTGTAHAALHMEAA